MEIKHGCAGLITFQFFHIFLVQAHQRCSCRCKQTLSMLYVYNGFTCLDAPLEVPEFLPATQKALFMRIHGKKVATDQDKGSDQNGAKSKETLSGICQHTFDDHSFE